MEDYKYFGLRRSDNYLKYITIDELNHFEYHDAEIKKIDFSNGNMIWHLSAVNATKENSQNSFDKDMCIKDAEIVFEHFNLVKIVFNAYKVYDSNNVLIESVEAKIANPDEYNAILNNTLLSYCYISSMEELPMNEDKEYQICFDIDGGAGGYYLTLSYSKSIAQWDEYSGKAWYEDEKWKKK